MREILFRGKRMDDGAWVYGYLVRHKSGKLVYIYQAKENWFDVEMVAPKTVGQFTGLTKNGKKIFEGDIVRYVNPEEDSISGRVVYGEHSYSGTHEVGFYVEWQRPEWAMWLRDDLGFWTNFREIEVIGNIHDNPELLEGGAVDG